jgi:hypothetical protein
MRIVSMVLFNVSAILHSAPLAMVTRWQLLSSVE